MFTRADDRPMYCKHTADRRPNRRAEADSVNDGVDDSRMKSKPKGKWTDECGEVERPSRLSTLALVELDAVDVN